MLNKQSRKIIHNVYCFMKRESEIGIGNLSQVQKRAALATNISIDTVRRIIKENAERGTEIEMPLPFQPKPKPIMGFGNVDHCAIRRRIHDYHLTERQVPCLKKIHKTVQETIKFIGSLNGLRRIVTNLGFRWKKTENNENLLIETSHVRFRRIEYLQQLYKYREEGRPIVYTDEVCMDSTQVIQDPETEKPTLSRQRVIVVHAASEAGILPETLITCQGDINTVDYHNDISPEGYELWLRSQLLPHLPENSVVVIDNASYHKIQCDPVPTPNSRRIEMLSWLDEKGILYTEDMLKPQLYNLIKMHKDKHIIYKIDAILAEHNHDVLRLPPYHRDLNPLDAAWIVIKDYVNTKVANWSFCEATDLIRERIQAMDDNEWTKILENVGLIEASYKRSDYVADTMMEAVISRGDGDDSSSSDEEVFDENDDDDNKDEANTTTVKVEFENEWTEDETIY